MIYYITFYKTIKDIILSFTKTHHLIDSCYMLIHWCCNVAMLQYKIYIPNIYIYVYTVPKYYVT